MIQSLLKHVKGKLYNFMNRSIRRWLRTVPTNSKVFLRGLLNMREKQILTSVIEIQK